MIASKILTRPFSMMRVFLATEAAGGIILILAAAAAMIVANSALSQAYFDALHTKIGKLSLLHWINDALMALFFLIVGLEIKREVLDGQLARWSDRLLPGIAAISGVALPALIYIGINLKEAAGLKAGRSRLLPISPLHSVSSRFSARGFRAR